MKVAIVGCGQIADAHIQEARKIEGVTVAAVCDANVHMAEQAASRFGIPNLYTHLGDMLKETRPDVVHVTTPPESHLPIGRTVLEHGCHAYIEKPLTVNTAEADELIELAVQKGTLICAGHNNAFDDAFLRLKEKLDKGELGSIIHVDVTMGYDLTGPFGTVFMNDPTHWLHRLPGGVAQNNISHPLSLVLEFLKDPKPNVHARGFRLRQVRYNDLRDKFFDELRVVLLGKETTAHLLFSCHAHPMQLGAIVYGSKCQAVVNIDARTLRIITGGSLPGPFQKIQWAYRDAIQANREYVRHIRNFLGARLHYFGGMNELFRRFYSAVVGKGDLPIPMAEARRLTSIMDNIFHQCELHDQGEANILSRE